MERKKEIGERERERERERETDRQTDRQTDKQTRRGMAHSLDSFQCFTKFLVSTIEDTFLTSHRTSCKTQW